MDETDRSSHGTIGGGTPMKHSEKQIGTVARELKINPKTIRYYEEIGLLPTARRTAGGYRVYAASDIDRISFILRACALDFSLDDITEILSLRGNGQAPCAYVEQLVEKEMATIDGKIAALNQLREELNDIRRQAQTVVSEGAVGNECVCHLIENNMIRENGA